MKIIKLFIVDCCKKQKTFNDQNTALTYLFEHIKKSHKKLFTQLDIQGRKLAQSQNGYGYYDFTTSEGWKEAKSKNPDFVYAWMKSALEKKLKFY